MTIALGILSSDGVVLAADTQITSPDYLKVGQGKVAWGVRRSLDTSHVFGVGITGSGSAAYVEYLQKEFIASFLERAESAASLEEMRELAKKEMYTFYSDHIIPFAPYGPNERPDVSMLLALRKGPRVALLITDKTTVTQSDHYAAVGAGTMYARILLDQFYTFGLRGTSAMVLAAYIVFQVKEYVDGCGKDTDVVCIGPHGVNYLTRQKVKELERIFETYSKIEAGLLGYVFSGLKADPPGLSRGLSSDIRKLRDAVKKTLASIQKSDNLLN